MLAVTLAVGVVAVAAMPPLGVFASEFLIGTETVLRAPWLALPLGVGLLTGAWALLARLQMLCLGTATPDRGPAPDVLAMLPVWLMLAVVLVLGLAMPAPVADWLRSASG
jgi:hydrogenase-4 component F